MCVAVIDCFGVSCKLVVIWCHTVSRCSLWLMNHLLSLANSCRLIAQVTTLLGVLLQVLFDTWYHLPLCPGAVG